MYRKGAEDRNLIDFSGVEEVDSPERRKPKQLEKFLRGALLRD
jgi:hypothetical protein